MACVYEDLDQFYLFFYHDMDKLLQLLNEYKKLESFEFIDYDEKHDVFRIIPWIYHKELLPETIISKKFWFIDRLIDQNKIEFDRARDRSDFPLLYAGWWEFYSDADIIVATLSIEDDPISFLVSVLK